MAKYFLCTLNKPALSFRTGEPMEFFVAAFEDDMPIACPQVQWELAGDDGQMREGLLSAGRRRDFRFKLPVKHPALCGLFARLCGKTEIPMRILRYVFPVRVQM